jgi:hypothetical protein
MAKSIVEPRRRPSAPPYAEALERSRGRGSPAVISLTDVRRQCALVSHDPDNRSVVVLLRLEGAEHPATRDKLRQLGFEPNASPVERSISWRRRLTEEELPSVADGLIRALDDACVLDVGASFAASGSAAVHDLQRPGFWHGRFLVHVGGTRWCVVFSADDDERVVANLFDRGREEYYENEFHSATE